MRETLPEAPPLAISFFTFEFVHYLVDRRRGTFPIRKPVDFILFAIFFPTLVAGPIKRYEQFLPFVARRRGERVPTGCHDRSAPGVAWVCVKKSAPTT